MNGFVVYLARVHRVDTEGKTEDEIFEECLKVSAGEYGAVGEDGVFRSKPTDGKLVGTDDGVIREVEG